MCARGCSGEGQPLFSGPMFCPCVSVAVLGGAASILWSNVLQVSVRFKPSVIRGGGASEARRCFCFHNFLYSCRLIQRKM